MRVAHLSLDDRVDEVQGEGVLLHAHRIQIVQGKFTDTLDQDGEFTAEEESLRLEVNLLVHLRG